MRYLKKFNESISDDMDQDIESIRELLTEIKD